MIGVLNAYRLQENAPPLQLQYGPMCVEFLKGSFPGATVSLYDIAYGKRPKSIAECEAWVITGSPKSAYDPDEWIAWLAGFIGECHKAQQKMIGICFGHQMIAHSLGGKTEKAKAGWGVGGRRFRVLKSKPWMQPEVKEMSLLFSHQDQVVRLPPGAELLAEDDFCPFEMYAIGSHIFCCQGHPEFTPGFAREIYDSRSALLGQAVYAQALATLGSKMDANILGKWMRGFVG